MSEATSNPRPAAGRWRSIRRLLREPLGVFGLVLVSPPIAFRSLSLLKTLQSSPAGRLPTMIVWGRKNSRVSRDAERLLRLLEPQHHPHSKAPLVEHAIESSLQGTALLTARLEANDEIKKFLVEEIAGNKSRRAWRPRATVGGSD